MIRLYLRDEIQEAEGFLSTPRTERGRDWTEHLFLKSFVSQEGEVFYVSISDPEDLIPEGLQPYIFRVSLNEIFAQFPMRVRGMYTKGSTHGSLDFTGDRPPCHRVRLVGQNREEVVELYHEIRAGTILPTESWEAEQISPLRNRMGRILRILRLSR